jgi:hypothetical protein
VAIGWLWYRDWITIGKCATCLKRAKDILNAGSQ